MRDEAKLWWDMTEQEREDFINEDYGLPLDEVKLMRVFITESNAKLLLGAMGEFETDRMRNYEIEEFLLNAFGVRWVLAVNCPFNGKYCHWGDFNETKVDLTQARWCEPKLEGLALPKLGDRGLVKRRVRRKIEYQEGGETHEQHVIVIGFYFGGGVMLMRGCHWCPEAGVVIKDYECRNITNME